MRRHQVYKDDGLISFQILRKANVTHLRCHDALPFGDEVALSARAVFKAALSLMSLEPRDHAVVTATGTLGPSCAGSPRTSGRCWTPRWRGRTPRCAPQRRTHAHQLHNRASWNSRTPEATGYIVTRASTAHELGDVITVVFSTKRVFGTSTLWSWRGLSFTNTAGVSEFRTRVVQLDGQAHVFIVDDVAFKITGIRVRCPI